MKTAKLRVEANCNDGDQNQRVLARDCRVFLNDNELHNITGFSFEIKKGGVVECSLRFYPDSIELDADVTEMATDVTITDANIFI